MCPGAAVPGGRVSFGGGQNQVGSSITSGTTAVLSTLHDPLCQDLAARFGQEAARLYVLANWEALEKYRTLAQRYACSWEEQPHYRYAMTQAQAERLKVGGRLLGSLGFAAAYHKETPCLFLWPGRCICRVWPNFIRCNFIWSGFRAEHSRIHRSWESPMGWPLRSGAESWPEDHCCHPLSPGPFRGLYFYEALSAQVLCDCPGGGPDVEGTYAGMGASGISLRNAGNLLFLSGGRHRTGGKRQLGDGAELCRPSFPGAAGGVCLGQPGLHDPGRIALCRALQPHTPDLYVATGFGAWGMTNSMAAATLLADLVQGKKSPYAAVYTPLPLYAAAPAAFNLGHTVSNFLRLTPKRCSHMGCALKWNPAEHSWDCPCHGSRFTADGSVLDGPAQSLWI